MYEPFGPYMRDPKIWSLRFRSDSGTSRQEITSAESSHRSNSTFGAQRFWRSDWLSPSSDQLLPVSLTRFPAVGVSGLTLGSVGPIARTDAFEVVFRVRY